MRELSNKEIQDVELGILKNIKQKCEENHLRYYIAYGTLIGAIRHQGFIPWDDDIDIVMPRKDYIKLIDVINSEMDGQYKIISVDTNSDFTAPLAKVVDTRTRIVQHYGFIEKVELGIYVDIFLLDGVGNDYEKALNYYNEAFALFKKWYAADIQFRRPGMSMAHSILSWIKHSPYKIKGYKYWLNKFEEHNKKYSYDGSKFVSVLEAGTPGAKRNVWPKSYFGDGINVTFEGEQFKAPVEYDKLLTLEYGDYMTPPPKELQVSHHYSDIYWR